jgi:hypothetical protein
MPETLKDNSQKVAKSFLPLLLSINYDIYQGISYKPIEIDEDELKGKVTKLIDLLSTLLHTKPIVNDVIVCSSPTMLKAESKRPKISSRPANVNEKTILGLPHQTLITECIITLNRELNRHIDLTLIHQDDKSAYHHIKSKYDDENEMMFGKYKNLHRCRFTIPFLQAEVNITQLVALTSLIFTIQKLESPKYRLDETLQDLGTVLHWFVRHFECMAINRDHILYLVKYPLKIHSNNDNSYHNSTGPAIVYEDETMHYFLNNVQMEEWMIAEWETLEPEKILTIGNVEQRSQIIKLVGISKILEQLDQEVIDRYEDYSLLSINLRALGHWRPGIFLKMKNPSVPDTWHIEGVAPQCTTVEQAINFRGTGKLHGKWKPIIVT